MLRFGASFSSAAALFVLSAIICYCVPGATECSGNPTAVANGLWDWNCSGTPDGGQCQAVCKPGYKSDPPPSATCLGNDTWSEVTGGCLQVCSGLPKAPLSKGFWPISCQDAIRLTDVCVGQCAPGYQGSPTVECTLNLTWATTVVGHCLPVPVCSGSPALEVENGRFPQACADTAVGMACKGVCNAGYVPTKKKGPAVACLADSGSETGGSWAGTATGSCSQVCPGAPDPTLLDGVGSFPESCINTVVVGDSCAGICDELNDFFGSPSLKCLEGGVWASALTGGCRKHQGPALG